MFGQSSLLYDNAYKIVRVFISKWQQVETEWGVSRVERVERERELQINRARDGVLDRYRNGVSWKWLLVKKTPEHFRIVIQ